jgi:hypothetical protein
MSQSINAGLGSVVAMIVPLMVTISTVINMMMIAARFTSVLWNDNVSEKPYLPNYTLVELVHNTYLTQARAFLISFVVAIVIAGLLILITSSAIAIVKGYLAQNAKTTP